MADIKIFGTLHNVTGEALARANEIYDGNKTQSEVNAEVTEELDNRYTKDETYSQSQLESMITPPEPQYITVNTYAELQALTTHPNGAIYRVAHYDGTQIDNTKFAEYSWTGSEYKLLAVRGNALEPLVGYYECDIPASTAAKTITASNYVLTVGGSIKIKMTNANTANDATLNINSTGAKALYYAGERASASNSWEAGETVEVYFDGTSYYANNVAGGSGSGDGVIDVSVKYPTSGVEGGNTYTLDGALAVLNSNLSSNEKKGGMSIKFILNSENKYVQYRYMGTTTTGTPNPFLDTTNWQGIDNEPTAGSDNLIKSDGVYNSIASAEKKAKLYLEGGQIDSVYGHNELIYSNGVIDVPSGNVREGQSVWRYSDFIRVTPNSTMILTENMTSSGSWGLAFYDKYKQGINVGVAYDNRTNYQITIPENAAFFRYSSNIPNSIIEITLHLVFTAEDTIPYEIDTINNKVTKGVNIFNTFVKEQSINWTTDRYYNYNGTIEVASGYECLKLETNGCTSIKTNIHTYNGYIVFFGSSSILQTITKKNSLEQVIYLPSGTVFVGLTNLHSAQTEPYVEVESLDDKLILGGGLSYDSLLTPIVWNKNHNYNAQGIIENNSNWECAKVPVGLKYIKFNFSIGGAKLVFFDSEDNVISHYTKNDTSFVTLLVPSNCKSIGLSNNWINQPNPVIYGIGLQKTLQDVIESVDDLRQDFEEEIAADIRYKVYGLGDSTNSDDKTRGAAIGGDEKRCMHFSATKIIAKRLNAAVYVNHSAPGSNIQYAYQKSQLIPNDATIVIIVVGINDLNNHYLPMGDIDEVLAIQDAADIPETTMFGVYLKMIRQLRERLPNNAQIVCVSPYFYSSDTIRTDLVEFREGIRKMCWSIGSRKGMRFIDGCDVGITPSNWRMLCRDTIHPMMEGQTVIASKILEHITPIELADEQYDLNETEGGLAMVPTPYMPLVSE